MTMYMQTTILRVVMKSSKSIQSPMSLIGAGAFFCLYSLISFNSMVTRKSPARIVNIEPAGNAIEKNRIQPICMKSSLYLGTKNGAMGPILVCFSAS